MVRRAFGRRDRRFAVRHDRVVRAISDVHRGGRRRPGASQPAVHADAPAGHRRIPRTRDARLARWKPPHQHARPEPGAGHGRPARTTPRTELRRHRPPPGRGNNRLLTTEGKPRMTRLAQTLGLTEFQTEIIATVRRFVDKEVIPNAPELERTDTYPQHIVDQMREMGLFGLMIPESYSGLGESLLTYALCVEELARGWMSVSGVLNTHFIVAYMLRQHGTDPQKRHHLPRMATGEARAAFPVDKPVGFGEVAPGLVIPGKIDKLGYKGIDTTELIFDGYSASADDILGDTPGQGFFQMMDGIEVGRVNVSARACGVGIRAFELAVRYAQQRSTFGKPIAEHQAIAFQLAEMATKVEAAHLMMVNAARLKDSGERNDLAAGMAKYLSSEYCSEVTQQSFRIHGGYGYSKEYEIERLMRDAPFLLIGEGTSEIQKQIISKRLLAEYRI